MWITTVLFHAHLMQKALTSYARSGPSFFTTIPYAVIYIPCLLIEVLDAVFHDVQLSIGHLGRLLLAELGLEQTDDGRGERNQQNQHDHQFEVILHGRKSSRWQKWQRRGVSLQAKFQSRWRRK